MSCVAELEKEVEELKAVTVSQAAKIQHLQYELMMALHRMWSRSSEKFEPLGPLLFDELAPEDHLEAEQPAESHEKPKTEKRGRKSLSPSLPRKEHLHELTEAQRMCLCGKCMVKIGQDVSEKLAMIPARVWVGATKGCPPPHLLQVRLSKRAVPLLGR